MYSKKAVFWSSCLGMLLFGIVLITLGSVIPDLRIKLNLDEISSGTLFSILPFGVLTGSMVFGPIVDKHSYKVLLVLSCIIVSTGFIGIGFTHDLFILKICAFLIGISGGALNGATNALVADISEKDKSANLSLLGMFFGIGALGMPLLLGILRDIVGFEVILSVVAVVALAAGMIFILVKFPPPKQTHGFPITRSLGMLKDRVLIMIAFFLFMQSSFEAILNNWTTTYLIEDMMIPQNKALIALSSFVAGMAFMRLLIGTIMRSLEEKRLLIISFLILFAGLILMKYGNTVVTAFSGLILLGAGLAAGFPAMLGITGNRYAELSGTAFSLVLFIALLGNMSVNYLMGVIATRFGINHLINVAIVLFIFMIILYILIFRKK